MFDFSPTLYVLLMILFATASFFIIRKFNQRRKRFASKYPNLSKNERLERLKQERLELAQAKKDMRKAIKAKKAEWKAEDKKSRRNRKSQCLGIESGSQGKQSRI